MVIRDREKSEELLCRYLEALAEDQGRQPSGPPPRLLPDPETVTSLALSPGPRQAAAWQKLAACSRFFHPAPKPSPPKQSIPEQSAAKQANITFILSPQIIAFTVAVINFLSLASDSETWENNDRERFIAANLVLTAAIDPPAEPLEWLLYDRILTPGIELVRLRRARPRAGTENRELFRALLAVSPLSELKHLDLELPEPIRELSGRYLVRKPGETSNAESDEQESKKSRSRLKRWWFRGEDIYADSSLRRVLIDSWLEMPENGSGAAGIGIFLEELRLRDRERFRRPILEFFEACDYLERNSQPADRNFRYPRLMIIDRLLKSAGPGLNRRGNERFLKFRALLEIIAEEKGVPSDFRHLSRDFCLQQLAPLARLATVIGGRREGLSQEFSGLRFSDRPS
jgi:hypothetical protein